MAAGLTTVYTSTVLNTAMTDVANPRNLFMLRIL